MTEDAVVKFKEKHPPKSPEEIQQLRREAQEAREKHTKDKAKVEENLMGFLERLDPLVDPATGNVLCWIRQLPLKELLELTPEKYIEAARESKSAEEMKEKLEGTTEEHLKFAFFMMSKVIAIPEKTPEEWEVVANTEFIALFEEKFREIYSRVSEQIDFF